MAKYKPQIRQDETTVVDLDLCAKYDGEGNDIVETYAKKGESGGTSIPFIELNAYATNGYLTQTQYNELVNANIAIILWSSNYFIKETSGESMVFSCVTRVNSNFMEYNYISVNNMRVWSTSSIRFPTSTGCILYMKNSDSSQGSTTPYRGSVIIGSGLKLNDGILSLAVSSPAMVSSRAMVSSPATVYVHEIKLSTQVCAAAQIGQGTATGNILEFDFYSSEGSFNNEPTALWSYIVGNNNWIRAINGTLYGSISGGETVVAINKETIDGTDYLCIQTRYDYGERAKYYVTEEDMMDLTKTQLTDSCRVV